MSGYTVFSVVGEPGFSGTWTAITTARGFDENLLNPKRMVLYVRYTAGGTAALRVGETLTGGTSSATVQLVAQAVESGTAGSGDSGIIFVRVLTGTPAAAGETWTGTSTGTVLTAQAPRQVEFPMPPKGAIISVENAPVNITLDGTTPTVSTGTNYGHTIAAGGSMQLVGQNQVARFKAINTTASNNAILKYTLLY